MRKPISYPASASSETVELCEALAGVIQNLPARPIVRGREAKFAAWLGDRRMKEIEDLTRDELSEYFAGTQRDLSHFERRIPEEAVVQFLVDRPRIDSPALKVAAGVATGGPFPDIRSTVITTQPDRQGRYVQFIAPDHISGVLSEVYRVWAMAAPAPEAVFNAVWLLAAVLNAHPFPDGNGRLARALCNAYLLKSGVLCHGALPLGALIYASRGNFEIAMRRVEIMQTWEPLCRFFLATITAYAAWIEVFEMTNAVQANGAPSHG